MGVDVLYDMYKVKLTLELCDACLILSFERAEGIGIR